MPASVIVSVRLAALERHEDSLLGKITKWAILRAAIERVRRQIPTGLERHVHDPNDVRAEQLLRQRLPELFKRVSAIETQLGVTK